MKDKQAVYVEDCMSLQIEEYHYGQLKDEAISRAQWVLENISINNGSVHAETLRILSNYILDTEKRV